MNVFTRAALLVTTTLPALAVAQGSATAPPPSVVESSAGRLKVERLAALEFPWGLAVLPDGRLLVTEKPGRLRLFDEGTLSAPLSGVPKAYHAGEKDQGGLLDVAVAPDFATSRLVYLSYVEAADPQPPGRTDPGDPRFGGYLDTSDTVLRGGAVARARLDGTTLSDVQVIWRQEPKTVGRGHFGHRIVFAPDGTLFITSGERMRFDPAQSRASNLGKVVRIRPDGSVPPDNPLAGQAGARGDVWSLGHRNILAAAVQPGTGQLWAVEMGPLGGDELNLVAKGKNYGWPEVSNGDNYDKSAIPDHPTKPRFEAPVKTWTPVISPSGMLFYSGAMFPAWRGHALVGGLSSKALVRLVLEGGRLAREERVDMGRRIRDVEEAPDGALILLVDAKDGELVRLSPAAAQAGR